MARNPYTRPTLRRPRKIKLASVNMGMAPGAVAGIRVRGFEVVQSIQSVDNSVRLISDKATVVRVYLDPASLASSSMLTGELAWRRGAGGMNYLPAMNRVKLAPSPPVTLQEQRFDADLSINFRMPPEAIGEGALEITLQRIFVPGGDNVPIATPMQLTVQFHSAPPLRVRVIGLRYKSVANPPSVITPDALHFNYLRSYLRRAYPVANVEWSQIVIDADIITPPFGEGTSDLVNAQLSAIRARELSTGVDPRTHYYGLVDDDRGRQNSFMRGSAVYNTQTRVFGLLASGPSGTPNGWTGDSDPSYADWYGAHELGHTFQRRHPGFPPDKQPQDPVETTFPYPEGLITTLPDNRFVGFDVGDVDLGRPMQALPGNSHHDVMTYADRQWLSAYTYEAVYKKLAEEDVLLAPVVG